MNAVIPERRLASEEISGLIERVTFHNSENGFCVLRVKTPGHRDETTVIGSLPSVTAGEWVVAEGGWVRDKEHGLQFKASTMKTVPPTTADGVERYPPIVPDWHPLPRAWRTSQPPCRSSFISRAQTPAFSSTLIGFYISLCG